MEAYKADLETLQKKLTERDEEIETLKKQNLQKENLNHQVHFLTPFLYMSTDNVWHEVDDFSHKAEETNDLFKKQIEDLQQKFNFMVQEKDSELQTLRKQVKALQQVKEKNAPANQQNNTVIRTLEDTLHIKNSEIANLRNSLSLCRSSMQIEKNDGEFLVRNWTAWKDEEFYF